jgi:hypothetical protein
VFQRWVGRPFRGSPRVAQHLPFATMDVWSGRAQALITNVSLKPEWHA